MTAWTSSPTSSSRRPNCCRCEQRAARAGRRGLHRRLQPLRGQARPPPQHPSLPVQRRARAFRAGARAAVAEPADQAAIAPPAARLLRRGRRADGPGAARRRRRRAAGLVARDRRAGGEDRPGRPAAARRTSIISAASPTPSCPPIWRGWDVALMPFAINEATRFISPTKTPEYLAGGLPVVSTPITDVVRHYGDARRRCAIADTPEAFVAACDAALALPTAEAAWRDEVDAMLADACPGTRPSRAWRTLIDEAIAARSRVQPVVSPTVWPAERPQALRLADRRRGLRRRGAGRAAGRRCRQARAGGRPAAAHRAATPIDQHDDGGRADPPIRPAHLPHQLARRSSTICRGSPSGGPTSTACWPTCDGQLVPMPINRTTLNTLYGLDLQTDEEAEAFLASRAEPVDDDPHIRGRGGLRRSGANSTRRSSAATPASSGAWTRPSSTSR